MEFENEHNKNVAKQEGLFGDKKTLHRLNQSCFSKSYSELNTHVIFDNLGGKGELHSLSKIRITLFYNFLCLVNEPGNKVLSHLNRPTKTNIYILCMSTHNKLLTHVKKNELLSGNIHLKINNTIIQKFKMAQLL